MTLNEKWRKPINAHPEEAYVVDSRADQRRGVKHIVTGPDRFDDMGRLLQGFACPHCLTPFPGRPGLDTIHMFKQGQMNYIGLRSEEDALALVAQGRCPICTMEVSLEVRDVMFMGTQNRIGEITKK